MNAPLPSFVGADLLASPHSGAALPAPFDPAELHWFPLPEVTAALDRPPFCGLVSIVRVHASSMSLGAAAVICVPVKNEAELLPKSLAAIEAAVVAALPMRCGVVVVVNNTSDASAQLVQAWAATSTVPVLCVEVRLAPPVATVAIARRLALDVAAAIAAPDAVLLSTDADTIVPEDWVVRMTAEVHCGAALVAGGLTVDPAELAALPARVRRTGDVEAELAALYETIWLRLGGDGPCPLLIGPSGANMAVSAPAYRAVGRLPTGALNEDRALGAAVARAGLAVALARNVVATASCRLDPRARNGMGDALVERCQVSDPHVDRLLLPLRAFVHRVLACALAGDPDTTRRDRAAARLGLAPAAIWARSATPCSVAAALADTLPTLPSLTVSQALVERDAALTLLALLDRGAGTAADRIAPALAALDTAVAGAVPRRPSASVPATAAAAFAVPDAVLEAIARRADAADSGTVSLDADIADLRACGALVAPLPTRVGGAGVGTEPHGTAPCLALLRGLGRANLSVARLVEGHVNAIKLIAVHADGATLSRTAASVRDGLLLGVWGADGVPPVAVRGVGDELVLSGSKRFASGLGLVGEALVVAATGAGPQLVLVPVADVGRADPGAWSQSGMRATRSGTYDVGGIVLSRAALVGAPGDLMREPHFEGGVWRYCAAHLGGAEALYDAMLARLVAADRAGDPHQARRIAEAAIACETARLWIEAAAAKVEREPADPEGAAAYALLAREATEAACLTVVDRVERALGVAAFDETTPVERMRRDLSLFVRQAGPDAKRARAARVLVATARRPEAL